MNEVITRLSGAAQDIVLHASDLEVRDIRRIIDIIEALFLAVDSQVMSLKEDHETRWEASKIKSDLIN